MLTGSVSSRSRTRQRADLVARLVAAPDKVVNSSSSRPPISSTLQGHVAKCGGDLIKQLGVDLS